MAVVLLLVFSGAIYLGIGQLYPFVDNGYSRRKIRYKMFFVDLVAVFEGIAVQKYKCPGSYKRLRPN